MRSALESTIVDEPPSRLDLDAIIARSRRRSRIRRLAGTAVAAVGLAAAAAIPCWLLGGVVATSPSADPPASSPGLSAPPALEGLPPSEPPAQAVARLDVAVREAVLAASPGTQFDGPIPLEHRAAHAVVSASGSWTGPVYMFWGNQVLTVAGVRGVMTVYTGRIDVRLPCRKGLGVFDAQEWSCETSTGPAGELVVTRVGRDLVPTQTQRRWVSVHVYRPDGSYVTVDVDNATTRYEFDPARAVVHTYTGEDPPLTVEQATAVALDPRITIYP